MLYWKGKNQLTTTPTSVHKNTCPFAIVCTEKSIAKTESLFFGGAPVIQDVIFFIGTDILRFFVIFVDDLDWD
jgi:hypothetical protein